MKKILLITLGFFASFQLMAQTKNNVMGRVTDSSGEKGLDKASIKLVEKAAPKDTLRTMTNAKGEFGFEKIPGSGYFIIVSYMGYKPMSKNFLNHRKVLPKLIWEILFWLMTIRTWQKL